MRRVAVLVPPAGGAPPPPERLPVGRAALRLLEEGIETVFTADGATGYVARPGGWRPVPVGRPLAVHDRFPSQNRPTAYASARRRLLGLPMGNPLSLTLLCRDKLASQRVLAARGLPMPPLEADPRRFDRALARWGAAFAKPRHGAMGAGVRRLLHGEPPPPSRAPGLRPGVDEPVILQRAVPPPPGLAGLAVRVLVQREPAGNLVALPGVARVSETDPVANVARGARAEAADDRLGPTAHAEVRALARRAAEALARGAEGRWLLEVGVDLVIDAEGRPHLIEVNSRPRGRLEALARLDPARYADLHVAACARPIRTLAALAAPPRSPA